VSGNNGQIQCINDVTNTAGNGRSAKYSYDELGRLSTALTAGSSTYAQWGLSWTYDRYGNRTAQTVTAGSAYSDSLAISTSTNQITGTGYSYDANGNMLGDGVNSQTFDAENRTVTTTNGAYVYDGNGLRVKKCFSNCSSPTTTTVYIFSGSKVIAEYDNGAAYTAPTREYLFAGGLKVATVDTATKYHLRDHLSVRVNTDSSGNIIGEQGHYPFGDSWYLNSTTTKEQFTTYERDPESGNDYAMARYNVNRLGRFSSVDPLSGNISDPQSLNRYAYVTNDPTNLTDPLGQDPMFELGGPAHSCTYDAYFGENACGDMCEARVSSSCDESGGGGGFFLSINVNFANLGDPSGESHGIPYGVTPPPFSLFNLLFGGNQQCEFGGFCQNSWQDGYHNAQGQPCSPSVLDTSCKRPTCIGVMMDAALEADPLGKLADYVPDSDLIPSHLQPGDVVAAGATAVALEHVVQKGLVVALRSSIVRSIFKWGSYLSEAAEVTLAAPTIYQLGVGVTAEAKSRANGGCRTAWESK
jgi:RHS repeat-associated protein